MKYEQPSEYRENKTVKFAVCKRKLFKDMD